ncbi:MAG: hypothetical protein LUE11_00085 [Clostridia bacterium]|nr:hypothetical protein [Clostridia bacterium]
MFRRVVCTASLFLLILCGCSAVNNPEDIAASVKETYANASDIEIVTDITSNLDEETMTYQIGYSYQKQDDRTSKAEMTVLAPESIAGIKANITGEDFIFAYEDTELETAMPDRKGLTPVDVTTYLLYDLMNDVPKQVWMENDLIALRYENSEEAGTVVKDVYVQPDSYALNNAHIYKNGEQIMACSFTSCTLQP